MEIAVISLRKGGQIENQICQKETSKQFIFSHLYRIHEQETKALNQARTSRLSAQVS